MLRRTGGRRWLAGCAVLALAAGAAPAWGQAPVDAAVVLGPVPGSSAAAPATQLAQADLLSQPLQIDLPPLVQPSAPAAPAAAAPVQAPTALTISTAAHAEFDRIVFDWPEHVGFTMDRVGDLVTIRFDRPADPAMPDPDVPSLNTIQELRRLPGSGNLAIQVRVAPGARLTETYGGRDNVVIDVSPAADVAANAAEAAPATDPVAPAAAAGPPNPGGIGPTALAGAQDAAPGAILPGGASAADRIAQDLARQLDTLTPDAPGFDAADGPNAALVAAAAPAEAAPAEAAPAAPAAVPANPLPGLPLPLAKPPIPVRTETAADQVALAAPAPAPAAEAALPEPAAAAPEPPATVETAAEPPTPEAPAQPAVLPAVVEPPAAPEFSTGAVSLPDLVLPSPVDAGPSDLAAIFDPGVEADIAVFQRAGRLWVVIASDRPLDAAALAAAGEAAFGPSEIVPAEGGVTLRFSRAADLPVPLVERVETAWGVVIPAEDAGDTVQDLAVEAQPDIPGGPRLMIRAPDARHLVRLVDPDVRDELVVVPLGTAQAGETGIHRYAQLDLLPSAQGLVLRPTADAVHVELVVGGVSVTAAGGLLVSSAADLAAAEARGEPPRLLDLARWARQGQDFTHTRQSLQQRVVDAPGQYRDQARLDLARFLLANGYAEEAGGLLRLVGQDSPALAQTPEVAALNGAVQLIVDRPAEARASFSAPSLATEPEARLWLGAAEAERSNWEAAATHFAGTEHYALSYPEPFNEKFALLIAEARLRQGDLQGATDTLDALAGATGQKSEYWAGISYLRGVVEARRGHSDLARSAWRRAANGNSRLYAAMAELAMLNLDLAEGEITNEEAVAGLEALRYAWRGDIVEFRVLAQLGRVYWTAGRYRDAFETWQTAMETEPDSPEARALDAERRDHFVALFTQNSGAVSATTAASLFEDFRSLLPADEQGDQVVEQVAERLVEIDLLDRAAALLQGLVDQRLQGPERARVALRLAGLELLQGEPQRALDILAAVPALDPSRALEQRLLQARALSVLGRTEEALAAIDGDEGRLADAARLDILWQAQRWPEAADSLRRLVGDPPRLGQPIPDRQAQLVLNYAIALSLSNQPDALNRLAIAFGPSMDASPVATTFQLLTRAPGGAAPIADLTAIRRQVAEVDLFQRFLASYRQGGPTPATTAAN